MRKQPLGQFLSYQTKQFWPFMVGGVVWFALITKIHMGITDKNRQESLYYDKMQKLTNPDYKSPHGHHGHH